MVYYIAERILAVSQVNPPCCLVCGSWDNR